jgi:hypothetical protein
MWFDTLDSVKGSWARTTSRRMCRRGRRQCSAISTRAQRTTKYLIAANSCGDLATQNNPSVPSSASQAASPCPPMRWAGTREPGTGLTQKVRLSLGLQSACRVWAVKPCCAGGAWHAHHLLLRAPGLMARAGTAMAAWLRHHLDIGWPSCSADPAPGAQVCSLAGVMMSAAENSMANCSGVPNSAPMRSVYLAR